MSSPEPAPEGSLAARLVSLSPLTLDTPDMPPNVKAAVKAPATASQILGLELLGFDIETGAVQMAFNVSDQLLNKWGGIQGGMVAAMLDEAIAFAAGLKLDWGQIVPTLEFKTSFLEAGRPGRLYAEGRTVRRGRSIPLFGGGSRKRRWPPHRPCLRDSKCRDA